MKKIVEKTRNLMRRATRLALEYGLPALLGLLRDIALLCGLVNLGILSELLLEAFLDRGAQHPAREQLTPSGDAPVGVAGKQGEQREEDRIWKLAFDPASPRLAFAVGKQVWVLSLLTHMMLTCEGHTDDVTALAWSPDGACIASASADGTVRVWELASASLLLIYSEHRSPVAAVAWSHDGQLVASGGIDGTICIWRAGDGGGSVTCALAHRGGVTALDWSADGSGLYSGGMDGHVRLWDPASAVAVCDFEAHRLAVAALACCPAKSRGLFASAGRDGSVRVWDGRRCLYTYLGHTECNGAVSLAWHPDGRRLISAGGDEEIHEWSPALYAGQSSVSVVVPVAHLCLARKRAAVDCLAVGAAGELLTACPDGALAAAGDGWLYVGPMPGDPLVMVGDLSGGRMIPLAPSAVYRKEG